ncbi:MAG: PqqD family protein [Opitutales bacterium]|nr:PqqD family protein [Opitutales bacterium]NRA26679.1 PqqD family protein [Opitutales bacterium]
MPFLRKKSPPRQTGIKDPMKVIPMIPEEVEAKVDDAGCVQLRRKLVTKAGIGNWIAQRFQFDRYKRINLDLIGSAFWAEVDGQSNLAQILKKLMLRHDWKQEEAQKAIITYTSELMKRGLLVLNVKPSK